MSPPMHRAKAVLGTVIVVGLLGTACGAPTGAASPSATGSPSARASAATPAPTKAPAASSRSPAPVPLLGSLPATGLDAATAARLQAVLDDRVGAATTDLIAAVITPEGTWTGAAGVDGPDGREATPADMFSMASITKVFTAALIMRLVDQGEIDLDQPLDAYLDGADIPTNGATIRQALMMRSGIDETPSAATEEVYGDCGRAWAEAEVVSRFPAPVAAPGAEYRYSNRRTSCWASSPSMSRGCDSGDAIQAELLDPVGAKRLLLQGPGHKTPRPWALPLTAHAGDYDVDPWGEGGTCRASPTRRSREPAARWPGTRSTWPRGAGHLFAGDLVTPASLAQMTTFDQGAEYGLGLERMTGVFGPGAAFGHGGNKPGFGSILVVRPEQSIVVVVMTNWQSGDVDTTVRGLMSGTRGVRHENRRLQDAMAGRPAPRRTPGQGAPPWVGYLMGSPSAPTTNQMPPTPWPLVSPAAVSAAK